MEIDKLIEVLEEVVRKQARESLLIWDILEKIERELEDSEKDMGDF